MFRAQTLQYVVLSDDSVSVTVDCFITGKKNTMTLPISEKRLIEYASDNSGALIQTLLPELTPAQREFLKTGMTEDDWDAAFSDED